MIALWFPQVSSIPSVSFSPIIPFSKHSIAKAMVQPVDMVSRPWRLQISLATIIESGSLFRHMLPNAPIVSYSGLWIPAANLYSPRPSFMIPPQCMGQFQHPYRFSCLLTKFSPEISSRSGMSRMLPAQFLIGRRPFMTEPGIMAQVPISWKNEYQGFFFISGKYFLRKWSNFSFSTTGTFFLPRTARALRPFDPMTAPIPERPAARPLFVITADIKEILSPAGPIQATRRSLPCSPFNRSSVSWVSFPQINCASRSSALPSSIKRYTGFSEAPVKKTASYPENLRYGPKSPPEFASPQVSVRGDLATTVNLPQKGTVVPVTGPVKKPRMFPGPKGLTPLSWRLKRIWAPNPKPPRKSRQIFSSSGSSIISAVVRFTNKIFPMYPPIIRTS